jgi:Rieske Fe-S protein
MDRRRFIKNACLSCSGLLVSASFLESCVNLPVIKQSAAHGYIEVDLSKLKPGQKQHIIRNPAMDFDILLSERSDGNYTALYMQCTHYSQPLAANSKNIFCPAHGSAFDFEGKVIKEPATQPLTKFVVQKQNEKLMIKLNQEPSNHS